MFPSSEDEVRRILRRMESGGNLGGYGMSGGRPGPYARPAGHRGGPGGPPSHQGPYGTSYNRPIQQNSYGSANSWSNSYDNYWNEDYNNSYRGYPKNEGPWGNNAGMNRGRGRMVGGGRPGHFVHLRGLPYSSSEQDIFQV